MFGMSFGSLGMDLNWIGYFVGSSGFLVFCQLFEFSLIYF